MNAGHDRLLSQEDAQAQLGGIGRTLLWELTRNGHLVSVKIGRRVMFPESSVQGYIEELKANARLA